MWRLTCNLLLPACLIVAAGLRASTAAESSFASDYGETKSAISTREAGELLLELVNAERARHGMSRLALSAPASRLAKEHADDMAAHNYVGHYDLAGRKCELRYNLLGETDHVAENLAMREIGARVRLTPELVRSIFRDWMGSRSHRDNILNAPHTHMGYGFALEHGAHTKIYAVQEFVNDWGECAKLPESVKAGSDIALMGKLRPDAVVMFAGLGSEAPPGARLPQQVDEDDLHYKQPRISAYYFASEALRYGKANGIYPPPYADEFREAVRADADGTFSVSVHAPKAEAPVDLYITVWARGKNAKPATDETGKPTDKTLGPDLWHPFKVMTQVVRVEPE